MDYLLTFAREQPLLALAALFTSPIILTITYLVIDSHLQGLGHIPGPFLARYTDAWNAYTAYKNLSSVNKADHWRRLQAQYGDVIRVGPKMVIVLDAKAVPTIYGVKNRLNKGPAYLPFQQPGVTTNLLAIPDDTTHSKYKKLVSNAYSMAALKDYEPYVDEMINRFTAVCDRHVQIQTPHNISLWCHYYAFDVVSKVTLGKQMGFMTGKGQNVMGLLTKTKLHGRYITWVANIPWMHKIIVENPIMRNTKPSPFSLVVTPVVKERLAEVKQGKVDPNGKKPDLLAHFIAAHQKDPQTMDVKQIVIMSASNLVAGGLTPGRVFDYLCHWVSCHPEAQERLHKELVAANVTTPAAYDDVKNLPYLDAVIRESYRAHSSANLQRVVGAEGLTLPDGRKLPAGCHVACPQAAVAEDPRVFGEDCRMWTEQGPQFKPEIWLRHEGETEEEFVERRRMIDRTELVFGQGSRICLGKSVAYLEIYKILATLMLLYRFEVVGTPKSGDVKVMIHSRN